MMKTHSLIILNPFYESHGKMNYKVVHTLREGLKPLHRVNFLLGLKRSMNCLMTILHEGSIRVYKEWLGHNVTTIIE